jgi:hypothetical protein
MLCRCQKHTPPAGLLYCQVPTSHTYMADIQCNMTTLNLLLLGLGAYKCILDRLNVARRKQPSTRHLHAGLGYLNHACLLCSGPTPEKYHRRLVAEYLRDKWADSVKIEIVHL